MKKVIFHLYLPEYKNSANFHDFLVKFTAEISFAVAWVIDQLVYFFCHMIPLYTSFIKYYCAAIYKWMYYDTSRKFQLHFTLYDLLYIILASNIHPMSNNKLLSSFLRLKLIHIGVHITHTLVYLLHDTATSIHWNYIYIYIYHGEYI